MRTYKIGDVINTTYGRGEITHTMTPPEVWLVRIKRDDAADSLKAQMIMWGAGHVNQAIKPSDVIEETPA